jgi:long-chain acyl-CoA synthetase
LLWRRYLPPPQAISTLLTEPLQLESVYRADQVVANICVYADTTKTKPIAVIVPVPQALKELASKIGVPNEHLDEMVHNDKLLGAVLKQLQASGRSGKLKGIEIIDGVVMSPEEWTPQNVGSP